jgi:hypothetical protein
VTVHHWTYHGYGAGDTLTLWIPLHPREVAPFCTGGLLSRDYWRHTEAGESTPTGCQGAVAAVAEYAGDGRIRLVPFPSRGGVLVAQRLRGRT